MEGPLLTLTPRRKQTQKDKDLNKNIYHANLGKVSYSDGLEVQLALFEKLVSFKQSGSENLPNFLLTCEHFPVFTMGKSAKKENIKFESDYLRKNNVDFFETNRGGDVTFHGLGQLIAYPIFDLSNFFTDLHKYMRFLEQTVIDCLLDFGVNATRIDNLTGVWVVDENGERKICAMGVKTSRWVTMHGIALNVNTDLSFFDQIVPCGIQDKKVTSLQLEIGNSLDLQIVVESLLKSFAKNFDSVLVTLQNEELLNLLPNEK